MLINIDERFAKNSLILLTILILQSTYSQDANPQYENRLSAQGARLTLVLRFAKLKAKLRARRWMTSSKQRIAAAIKRFPFILRMAHAVWRLTRPRYSVGVVGVLFNQRGELLIVEHVYHTYPQWGLPGGYMDRGENPPDAVARELHEELGMRVTVGKPLLIERAAAGHLDFAYQCYSDDPVGELSSELLDYQWVHPDQLPELRKFQRKAIAEALVLLDEKV